MRRTLLPVFCPGVNNWTPPDLWASHRYVGRVKFTQHMDLPWDPLRAQQLHACTCQVHVYTHMCIHVTAMYATCVHMHVLTHVRYIEHMHVASSHDIDKHIVHVMIVCQVHAFALCMHVMITCVRLLCTYVVVSMTHKILQYVHVITNYVMCVLLLKHVVYACNCTSLVCKCMMISHITLHVILECACVYIWW